MLKGKLKHWKSGVWFLFLVGAATYFMLHALYQATDAAKKQTAANNARLASQATTTVSVPADFVEALTDDKKLSVKVPAAWKKFTDLPPKAVLGFVSPVGGRVLLSTSPVPPDSDISKLDPGVFADRLIQSTTLEPGMKSSVVSKAIIDINGRSCVKIVLSVDGNQQHRQIGRMMTLVESNMLVIDWGGVSDDEFNKMSAIVDEVTSSIVTH